MMIPKFTSLARLHSMGNYLFSEVLLKRNRFNSQFEIAVTLIILKVSKVSDCGLKRIGDLGYDFVHGTCATYNFPTERILLCFSDSNDDYLKKCER